MVIYRPITDVNKIKNMFKLSDVDNNAAYGAYEAFENDCNVGCCLVKVIEYKCVLSDITESDDKLIVEGLIRAGLNFAANRNAYMAYCSQQSVGDVLSLLGFENDNGLYSGDIPMLLQGSCCKDK